MVNYFTFHYCLCQLCAILITLKTFRLFNTVCLLLAPSFKFNLLHLWLLPIHYHATFTLNSNFSLLFCFLSDLQLQGFVHALSAVKTLIKYKPYFDCLIQTNETERSELCAMIPNKEENWNYSNNKNPQ